MLYIYCTIYPETVAAGPRPIITVDDRVNDIALKIGISLQQIDRPIYSSPFLAISQEIVPWQMYGEYLGLSDADIQYIVKNHPRGTSNSEALMMLKMWKKQSPSNSYRKLLRACLDVDKNAQLVGKICAILSDPKYTGKTIVNLTCIYMYTLQ